MRKLSGSDQLAHDAPIAVVHHRHDGRGHDDRPTLGDDTSSNGHDVAAGNHRSTVGVGRDTVGIGLPERELRKLERYVGVQPLRKPNRPTYRGGGAVQGRYLQHESESVRHLLRPWRRGAGL